MTITFLKEIATGIIHKFQEGETPVYPNQFTPATQDEIAELLLSEAKKAKIEELEKDYHNANLEPKIHEALVLTGKGTGTVREFNLFQKYNNPIPALDTDRYLIICINTNKNMPYPTIAKEGDKITVKITPVLAKSILDHMVLRYQQNFAKFTVFATQVFSIVYDPKLTTEQNIAKVDAIKWSNQFDPKILEPVSKLLNS